MAGKAVNIKLNFILGTANVTRNLDERNNLFMEILWM